MSDNKEVQLQIEDAMAVAKLLHRVIFDNHVIKQLDEKKPYVTFGHPGDISAIRLSVDEINRLKTVSQIMEDLVRQHREQARKELEALGERLYMEGDGILMVEPLVDPMEYRAFAQTVSGTVYLGSFPTEEQARAAWHDTTKKNSNIDLYKYVYDEDLGWQLVQWAEFNLDDDIAEGDIQFDLDVGGPDITRHGDDGGIVPR